MFLRNIAIHLEIRHGRIHYRKCLQYNFLNSINKLIFVMEKSFVLFQTFLNIT